MARLFTPKIASYYEEYYKSKGVDFIKGTVLSSFDFDSNGKVYKNFICKFSVIWDVDNEIFAKPFPFENLGSEFSRMDFKIFEQTESGLFFISWILSW